jgi:hypothetical protein
MYRVNIKEPKVEGATALIEGKLVDAPGDPIDGTALTTLTLTLYDEDTDEIINSRDDSDIKNTGGGSVDASGNFSLLLAPADMPIQTSSKRREQHIALVEWSYPTGNKGAQEFAFTVVNLHRRT